MESWSHGVMLTGMRAFVPLLHHSKFFEDEDEDENEDDCLRFRGNDPRFLLATES